MKGPANPSTGTLGLALIVLLAAMTALDAMAIDMYLPGMPDIAREFGVPPGRVQQTLSIFLAGLAMGQAIYGPLLDRFGRRVPLLVGIGIFVVGSVMGALAPSTEWLLVARFVQAIGAAAGLVAPRAIVADLCDLQASARIFSLLMQVMMIAPILAPLLGGFMLSHGGWRSIFWVLALLGAVTVVWGLRMIPDSLPREQRAPLHARPILAAFGRQLCHPVFMAYSLCGGFALGALFTYISGSAFVFTGHFQLTPTGFSYLFAANSVCLVMGGMLANRLLNVGMSSQRILFAGLIVHTAAALTLFVVIRTHGAAFPVYAALLALAIGSLGLVFGNAAALTMNHAGRQAGTAAALMGTLHYLISAVVGAFVSFTPAGLGQLPIAIGACGLCALTLCRAATRLERRRHTTT